MIDQRLSHFQITAKLGEGGMGEVYRARDTGLDRDVAIKVLPPAFTADPGRLARFEREAKLLASLNHPHIAGIYEVGEATPEGASEPVHFLAMELAEGEDLSARLARGPLPVDESLEIARQIAEALEAAHERGIVHRDLKPQNIKITPDGSVKILDFGLAKAMAPDVDSSDGTPDLSHSPTMTFGGTVAGVVLGTAAYMAPEQARGKPVDRRGDIWAFGAVLYEMLTGERLFRGETASDILAAVLTRDVDLGALPEAVPASARSLLARSLERDPRQRLRDIGEARVALERIEKGEEPIVSGVVAGESPESGSPTPPTRVPWVVAVLASLAALVLGALAFLRPTPPEQSLVFELAPPPDTRYLIGANIGHGYLSPDGSKVAFLARGQEGRGLWVRTLASGELRELPGTTEAFYPFWSPDGRKLAFFSGTQLMVVDVAAGLPEVLADVPQGRGGSWSESGEILLTPIGGGTLHRLSPASVELEPMTELDATRGENAHYWPQWLPGGEAYLYFVRSTQSENNGIYLGSVDGEPPIRLVTTRSSGIYAPSRDGGFGHLLWVRDGELLAQSLDVEARRLVGEVSVIASDVRVDEAQRQLLASVSADGTLLWASASAVEFGLALYGRDGRRIERLPIPPGQALEPKFSPDGRQVLHTRVEGGTADIWLFDFDSGRTTQVTTDASFDELGIWVPDGKSIVYRGENVLARKVLGGETSVLVEDNQDIPSSFTPDGRFLIVDQQGEDGDFGYVDLSAPGSVKSLLPIPGREGDAAVSPDGRWMAFAHQVGDRPEVVVAPLLRDGDSLGLGRPWLPVSNRGGIVPHWRADGRELIYVSTEGALHAVAVTPSGDTLRLGTPEELFFLQVDSGGWRFAWGASPDHESFVLFEEFGGDRQTLHVLTDWQNRLSP